MDNFFFSGLKGLPYSPVLELS